MFHTQSSGAKMEQMQDLGGSTKTVSLTGPMELGPLAC